MPRGGKRIGAGRPRKDTAKPKVYRDRLCEQCLQAVGLSYTYSSDTICTRCDPLHPWRSPWRPRFYKAYGLTREGYDKLLST